MSDIMTRDMASASTPVEAMMARYLGPAVVSAFADDDVTEIYTNPIDTKVRFDTRSVGRVVTSTCLSPDRVLMFLDCVAALMGTPLDLDAPTITAELPKGLFRQARLQGFIPPVTVGPAFAIRKPPTRVYRFDDYVRAGAMTTAHANILGTAVAHRNNIIVIGGTNTGKTTVANAILHEIATRCPTDRLVILEDTIELQCPADDHLALRAQPGISLRHLVKSTLRASPNRIIVGEVRDESALDLLDAWATGHPGGVATFHATDPLGALHRLDRLAQRANVPSQRHLIAEAIDLIVVMEQTPRGRCLTQMARVTGLHGSDSYSLDVLARERAPATGDTVPPPPSLPLESNP